MQKSLKSSNICKNHQKYANIIKNHQKYAKIICIPGLEESWACHRMKCRKNAGGAQDRSKPE